MMRRYAARCYAAAMLLPVATPRYAMPAAAAPLMPRRFYRHTTLIRFFAATRLYAA